ncbi:hypothetical protein KFL_002610180 [Klebsormidium nitens]|uniref:Uncharacterized protein n=1 Tax=Klebsormidium nitens TaxID=105231 RepID=A0A1Y1I7M0_KLENI|nr:hypothetical protein KFL_002610180 [Klebsormidium nitens]|eukprot:GAQ85932.1 hypothetical protein KFL_002610180 [Klebsormidium nitens]
MRGAMTWRMRGDVSPPNGRHASGRRTTCMQSHLADMQRDLGASGHRIQMALIGRGIAWDCLDTKMRTPFVEAYTVALVRRGAVICNETGSEQPPNVQQLGIAAGLVLLHVILLVAPIVCVPILYKALLQDKVEGGVKAPSIIFAAMAVFSVSSFGEIGLHIQQQWVYYGLAPSYYSVVFYSGLVWGQALLAWGVGGYDSQVLWDLLFSAAGTAAMIRGTALANAVPDSNAFCAAKLLNFTLSSWNLTANAGDGGFCGFLAVQIFLFIMLGLTTASFLLKANSNLASPSKWLWTILIILAYVAGIVFTIVVEVTGEQWWHLPTALSFVFGFLFQVAYILSAYTGQKKSPLKEN